MTAPGEGRMDSSQGRGGGKTVGYPAEITEMPKPGLVPGFTSHKKLVFEGRNNTGRPFQEGLFSQGQVLFWLPHTETAPPHKDGDGKRYHGEIVPESPAGLEGKSGFPLLFPAVLVDTE